MAFVGTLIWYHTQRQTHTGHEGMMFYYIMFYYINQPRAPSFPIGLVKTESDFIVRSVDTGLGRLTLVVAMISVDAYPFFGFLRPDLLP